MKTHRVRLSLAPECIEWKDSHNRDSRRNDNPECAASGNDRPTLRELKIYISISKRRNTYPGSLLILYCTHCSSCGYRGARARRTPSRDQSPTRSCFGPSPAGVQRDRSAPWQRNGALEEEGAQQSKACRMRSEEVVGPSNRCGVKSTPQRGWSFVPAPKSVGLKAVRMD
jgi:hypothetical protein